MSIFTREKEPSVLILKGVSLSELLSIDDLWSDSTNSKEVKAKLKYCKLPEEFYGLDTWILKSNLQCCYCGLTYTTIPIGMPIRYIKREDGKSGFQVRYNFCSFPCCMKQIVNTIHDTSLREYRMTLLKLMFNAFFNTDIGSETIEMAPDKLELQEYGGNLTIDDFKKKINRTTSRLVDMRKLDKTQYLLSLDTELT